MSYVIAFSSEKGGSAKTTSTLWLGATLAEAGHKVLVMDLDPLASLTLALGSEPAALSVTSSQILIESAPLSSACLPTDIPNLDLVPSQSSLESAEHYLPVQANYTLGIRRALEAAAPLAYDFVLLDCPPFLGAITTNALSAANLLIIPTLPDYFAAYALRNMMALIRRVRQESNPGLIYRILITVLDPGNRMQRGIVKQMRTTFGEGVLQTAIEVDPMLRQTTDAASGIASYRPHGRAARQYRELAGELTQYLNRVAAPAA
jgi:chromosome partitioning protein